MKRFLEPGLWLAAGILPPLMMLAMRGLSDPFWALELSWVLAVSAGWAASHADAVAAFNQKLSEPRKIWRFTYTPRTVLLDLACMAAIVIVVVSLLPKTAMGLRPVDHDHPVHIYKAWNLWENFLKEGRLYGWSHQWFAGYAPQYLYPIGTDLLVIALKVLTLGMLTLDQAYAFAFFGFYALKALGVYALGRVSVGRWAGLIAALIYIGDGGGFRFGGFVYTAQWGVWPQGLSIALSLLGLAMMKPLLFGDKWRHVAGVGLLFGAALLTHPMQLMHLALTFPVLMLALALSNELAGKKLRAGMRALTSYGIAGAIGALWLLPFISVSGAAESYGQPWRTLYDMGKRFHDANLLEGSWSFWIGAAVIGTAGLLFSRRILPSFLGLMTLLLLAASSHWVLAEFHFIELSEKFWFIQWQRFSMLLKPYMLLAAGAAIVGGFDYARGRLGEGWSGRNAQIARVFIVAIIAAPIAYGFINEYRSTQLRRGLTEVTERPQQKARQRFIELANAQWEKRAVPFYRIALQFHRHDHSVVDLGMHVKAPLYKTGFMPAAVFKYKPESASPSLYEAMNIRYVLTNRKLSSSRFTLIEDLGEGLKYYEFNKWHPDPFEVIEGEGDVKLVSWDTEEIVLEAAQGAKGKLRLNVSKFPRWHVYRDGKELDVQATSVPIEKDLTGFMTFELAPGKYRIVFEREAPETLGGVFFIIGIFLALSLLLLDLGRPRAAAILAERLKALLARVDTFESTRGNALAAAAFAGFTVVVLGAIGLAIWIPRVPLESKDAAFDEVVYDFTESLNEARVSRVRGNRASRCPFVLGKHLCGAEEHTHVYSTLAEVDREFRRCTWAHPLEDQTLRITFDDIPTGKKIVGWYAIAQSGYVRDRSPVDFVVGIDGVAAFTGATKVDNTPYEFVIDTAGKGDSVDLTFEVKAKEIGRRHFCFQAQVVE